MKTASPEVAEEIARVQAMLRSAGVGQVVRVVASKIAAMQLERPVQGSAIRQGSSKRKMKRTLCLTLAE
jgi:hypothetical protein